MPCGCARCRWRAVRNDLLERLASRPGVVSAAEVGIVPVSGSGWNGSLRTDSASAGEAAKESNFNRVGPGYFRTMGTQLVAGRDFDVRDNLSAPKIAIVNESFVKKIFNGENPVGRSIRVEALRRSQRVDHLCSREVDHRD